MTANRAGNGKRIVLLAADVCSYSTPVIDLAAEIAASIDSKLQGVFIEDEEFLNLLQSPLTREISLMTASATPTGGARMQRMLRSVARQFETALEREAQARKIAWSYEYVRGRMRDFGLKASADTGITILGRTGLHRVRSGGHGHAARVLVIADRSARQADTLAVVMRRFGAGRKEITLVTGTSDEAMSLELQSRIGAQEAQLTFTRVERDTLFDLLRRSGQSFDCAILSMHENAEDLALILTALQCPVILVG